MSLFNHNINNLSGGVSQQAEEARYDNQVESMINYVPTVAQGLRRRNPIKSVATLGTTFQSNMAIHSYSRGDGVEEYGMIMSDNGLEVFDTSGVQKTVNDFGATSEKVLAQWAGTDWENDIEFLTVGDTTWMLNSSKVVTSSTSLTPNDTYPYSAFFWIKKSFDDGGEEADGSKVGHGYKYEVDLQDLGSVSHNHSDSIEAALFISNAINGNNGYISRNEGSIVYVRRSTDFTISTGDSWGNQASMSWKSGVAKIADLPATMDGFTDAEVGTIAITGTDKDNFNSYYLKWDTDHWTETVSEGVEYKLNHLTMPAKIVRQGNGTFSLGWNVENLALDGFANTWGERTKGDDDSNPMPSFVGNTLSNMFFFKNRLSFTSEENVILSVTGSYYEFFATTVMEILDSDPIDASADSNNISLIRAVNVTAGAVTLWTDTAQFILSGGDILSPATTRISQTSTYVADTSLKPLSVDNEIMFFSKRGLYLDVLSYAPATVNNDTSTAISLASHIPEYLPSTITGAVAAPNENMVIFYDSADTGSLYVYKYHIDNSQRIMSAWFKWTFEIDIKKIEVLSNKLFILSGTNSLHSMDLNVIALGDEYLDSGATEYLSEVTLSRFNIATSQKTQNIREFFYVKTVKSIVDGEVDVEIINKERNNSKTILSKHVSLGRRILVGGHSDKVTLKYKTNYHTGVSINAINIEGQMKVRSQNR